MEGVEEHAVGPNVPLSILTDSDLVLARRAKNGSYVPLITLDAYGKLEVAPGRPQSEIANSVIKGVEAYVDTRLAGCASQHNDGVIRSLEMIEQRVATKIMAQHEIVNLSFWISVAVASLLVCSWVARIFVAVQEDHPPKKKEPSVK